MKANEDKRFRLPRTNRSLLSGILKCSNCGSFLRPKLTRTEDSEGNIKFSYMCELKDRSRRMKCNIKNLNGIETDKIVLDIVKKMTSPKSEIYKALKKLSTNVDEVEEKQKSELKELNSIHSKNKMEKEGLIDTLKYTSESNVIKEITKEIDRLMKANLEIEKQIYKISSKSANQISDKETAELVLDILNNYHKTFDELDTVKQRELIKLLINFVETDGENLTIDILNARGSNINNTNIPLCKDSK